MIRNLNKIELDPPTPLAYLDRGPRALRDHAPPMLAPLATPMIHWSSQLLECLAETLGLALRSQVETDSPFLLELFSDLWVEQMAPMALPESQASPLIRQQFEAQRRAFAELPGIHHSIVELPHADGTRTPIGRFYLSETPEEICVVDITLAPAWRGQGIGSTLLRAAMEEAQSSGRPVRLHVTTHNPAKRLYQRLGFTCLRSDPIRDYMEWVSPKPDARSQPSR